MAMRINGEWKRGLPPGKYYEGMIDDYEVYYAPIGVKWHRRRTPEEREQYIRAKEANRQAATVHGPPTKSSESTPR